MISLDIKKEASTSSLSLILLSQEETPTLSFSDLLKGVTLKQDTQLVQNGAIVLSLENDLKELAIDKKSLQSDKLLSLFKDEIVTKKDMSKREELPLKINPKLAESLNITEFKTLIHDAKTYLKNKIIQSDGFKNAEIQALPKTLKGLVQVAKKFAIEVSKITIEDVKQDTKVEAKVNTKQLLVKNKSPHLNINKSINQEEIQNTKQEIVDKKVELPQTLKSTPLFKAETQTEQTTEQFVQTKILSTEKKTELPQTLKSTPLFKAETQTEQTTEQFVQTKILSTEKKTELPQTLKSTPLFKAETQTEQTTEQFVQTKILSTEKKTELPQTLKSTPLFKAETQTEQTTEQFVQTKILSTEKKTELPQTLKSTPLFKAETQTEHTTEQFVQTKILSTEKKTELPQTLKSTPLFKAETQTEHTTEQFVQTKILSTEKKTELPQTLKSTPLFKAETQTEQTTEQFVQTKILSTEKKVPQQKTTETLRLLLSGDKVVKQETSLTADFSVASAKVIAPKIAPETINTFENLLKGDNKDSSDVNKLDGLTTSKADSFEVKLNEAKQMTKYLSQDVKNAIEDYKSPFTRLKVQLNPKNLGEIDLTIVQRGKNLHINLSSNNVAINTLAMNAQDLKTQLANSGINNATLNFNNSSQSDQSGANQQHQQKHQGQKAQDEYNYFESQETNEEILSSLEIVVPHYA